LVAPCCFELKRKPRGNENHFISKLGKRLIGAACFVAKGTRHGVIWHDA
jgi:hypothetical protein